MSGTNGRARSAACPTAHLAGELSVLPCSGREIAELVVFRTPGAFAGLELPPPI
ncbi:MAG: hypothetical protein JSS68_12575 [Actinobacteria bacterium]|nr:hypothetical protein [Actinomycetota bacterium]